MAPTFAITEKPMQVDTHKTYDVQFYPYALINTTVTHNPTVVTNWIDDIKKENPQVVGLDVEYPPSSDSNKRSRLATLQLCVGKRCLIYQIGHSDKIPQSLASFLSHDKNKPITFVGDSIKTNLNMLHKDYGIGDRALFKEAQELKVKINADIKEEHNLTESISVVMPEKVMTSLWNERQLTAEQVMHACLDAYVSFRIGKLSHFGLLIMEN